jgi:fanconi-associated nuclease 1
MKRLESLLKLDRFERRKCHYKQKKHKTRTIEGERIWVKPHVLDHKNTQTTQRRPILKDAANIPKLQSRNERECPMNVTQRQREKRSAQVILAWRKGKTVWRGKEGEEVTVEEFSLQHYEKFSFKGWVS